MVFELYFIFRAAWTVAGLILFVGALWDGDIISPAEERRLYEFELQKAGDKEERKSLSNPTEKKKRWEKRWEQRLKEAGKL